MSQFLRAATPIVLGQSAVAVSHTGGTTETTLATITIPAGAMGANGQVIVEASFAVTGNTNTKTPRIRLGGTLITSLATATASVVGMEMRSRIANVNAANSQKFRGPTANPYGTQTSSAAFTTAAIDTTAAADITITGQLGTGTDTITLEAYQVLLYPSA